MYPLAIAAIAVGGVIILWGGYEAFNTLYEWHKDRQEEREYEEYVRMHAEKGRYSVSVSNLFERHEEESDTEDDNTPLVGTWRQKSRDSLHNSGELRHRNVGTTETTHLSEMERSISARRTLLQHQNEILLNEEAELERQKHALRVRGNSLMGVFHDIDDANEINPFSDEHLMADDQFYLHSDNKSDLSDSWSDIDRKELNLASSREPQHESDSFEKIDHHQNS